MAVLCLLATAERNLLPLCDNNCLDGEACLVSALLSSQRACSLACAFTLLWGLLHVCLVCVLVPDADDTCLSAGSMWLPDCSRMLESRCCQMQLLSQQAFVLSCCKLQVVLGWSHDGKLLASGVMCCSSLRLNQRSAALKS
jgi:hypothetical protein